MYSKAKFPPDNLASEFYAKFKCEKKSNGVVPPPEAHLTLKWECCAQRPFSLQISN